VRNRPDQYDEAVLGKPPGEYSTWIQDSKTWGGEIELFILSQYYGAEILAIEIKSQHSYVYGARLWCGVVWWVLGAGVGGSSSAFVSYFKIKGEGKNYQRRIYVLYDGCERVMIAITTRLD